MFLCKVIIFAIRYLLEIVKRLEFSVFLQIHKVVKMLDVQDIL